MTNKFAVFTADAIILLAFLLLFFLLGYIEIIRSRSYWEKEKEIAYIFKDLASISSKILNQDANLINYPNIAFYLSRVISIARNHEFDLNRITVTTVGEMSDYPQFGFSKEGFCEEIISLTPKSSLLQLVLSCSRLFGRIYKIKHPIKYSYVKIKKKISLRFLSFKLELLNKISKIHSDRIEEDLKTEVKEKVEETELDCDFVSKPELVTI